VNLVGADVDIGGMTTPVDTLLGLVLPGTEPSET